STLSPAFATSIFSSVSPAMRTRSLWQLIQYLSRSARSGAADKGAEFDADVCAADVRWACACRTCTCWVCAETPTDLTARGPPAWSRTDGWKDAPAVRMPTQATIAPE